MCGLAYSDSEGRLVLYQVCQFNNATCGSFQALAQRGYLWTTIMNTGAITGAYYVEVGLCHALPSADALMTAMPLALVSQQRVATSLQSPSGTRRERYEFACLQQYPNGLHDKMLMSSS